MPTRVPARGFTGGTGPRLVRPSWQAIFRPSTEASDGEACLPAPERPKALDAMTGKVAIITEGSRGVAAGVVAGYRGRGWAVVASARTIRPSQDPDLLTVAGDIADPATADRIVGETLERFGRIDTLVN